MAKFFKVIATRHQTYYFHEDEIRHVREQSDGKVYLKVDGLDDEILLDVDSAQVLEMLSAKVVEISKKASDN